MNHKEFAVKHAPALAKNITELCGKVITKGMEGILQKCVELQEQITLLTASRDEYQREADKLAMELKALRDSFGEVALPEPVELNGASNSVIGFNVQQLHNYGDRRVMAERERIAEWLNRNLMSACEYAEAIRQGETK